MEDGVRNAKIESTYLGIEDHGIFTALVMVDYGGSVQGLQVCLGHGKTGYAFHVLTGILEAVEAEQWERLPGKAVRVKIEGSLIRAIGHFLKDKWCNPQELAKSFPD